jgi:hypothetical protein
MDRHPFTEDVDAAAGADSLLASTLFLLARHAAAPCPRLADLVDRHLAAIASHAGCGILVRETSRRLVVEGKRPPPDCPLGFAAPPCKGGS